MKQLLFLPIIILAEAIHFKKHVSPLALSSSAPSLLSKVLQHAILDSDDTLYRNTPILTRNVITTIRGGETDQSIEVNDGGITSEKVQSEDGNDGTFSQSGNIQTGFVDNSNVSNEEDEAGTADIVHESKQIEEENDVQNCSDNESLASVATSFDESQENSELSNHDNENPATSSSSMTETMNSKQTEASNLRLQGKQFHDDGDFQTAAETFEKAASELDFVISMYQDNLQRYHLNNAHTTTTTESMLSDKPNDTDKNDDFDKEQQLSHSDFVKLSEERATCRLHEALCHLKNKNYADSIISCTDVLMDGVQVVALTDEERGNMQEDDDEDEDTETPQQAVVVRISPSGGGVGTKTPTASMDLSPAIRARAYHRRAKARLALGDSTGALDDARSAAFLGDRNAVALYGKLMRESGSKSNFLPGNNLFESGESGSGGGDLSSLFSSSSASPLQSLLAGVGDPSDSAPSFDMLSTLMGGLPSEGNNSPSPLGALGGLGGLLQGNSSGGSGGGMDSLAKSVLTSLTKRIEDESTQEMLCGYLNGVDATQISSLSSMAGVPLSDNTVERIVKFANGVTPKGMRKTITLAKRLLFLGNIVRKTFQVIGKYKHLIVVMVLIAWIKSAILRPVVVSKKAIEKAAKAASKASFIM